MNNTSDHRIPAADDAAVSLEHRLHPLAAGVRAYLAAASEAMRSRVMAGGALDAKLAHRHQRALHGLAWLATTGEAIVCTAEWGLRLAQGGRLGAAETLLIRIGVGEYLQQLAGGIPMSQNEIFRPEELGLADAVLSLKSDPAVAWFLRHGNTAEARSGLIEQVRAGAGISEALPDADLNMVRDQFRRFSTERIAPHAHQWHLADELIPDSVVGEMAELGVFGICIDTEYGGLGMGKLAMCVVTEELSRAWIAAGSLGMRSEIAGELIS